MSNLENESTPNAPNDYVPDLQEQNQLSLLVTMVKRFENAGIKYVITGGYGLDGLYGKLTRSHEDIDVLIDSNDFGRVRTLLSQMGFEHAGSKKTGYEVFRDSLVGSIAGVKTWETLDAELQRVKDTLIPRETNGMLLNQPFRTLTLDGHEAYTAMNDKRAIEENWEGYPEAKARNKKAIIQALRDRGSDAFGKPL